MSWTSSSFKILRSNTVFIYNLSHGIKFGQTHIMTSTYIRKVK